MENVTHKQGRSGVRGFSLIELMVILSIILIATVAAVPTISNGMDTVWLRESGTDYSGILQSARMKAAVDNRFYSVLPSNQGNILIAYIDTYPQNANGTSGNGSYDPTQHELSIVIGKNVIIDNVNAPATANLQNQVVPSSSGITMTSFTPSSVTFSSRGLPCIPVAGGSGGATCYSSAGTPVAYATYFRSPRGNWEAVTVTPAGRIQTWRYDNTSWGKL